MKIEKVRNKLVDEFLKLDGLTQNKILDNLPRVKAKLYLNLFECDKEDWEKSQFMFCLGVLLHNKEVDDKGIDISKKCGCYVSSFHKLIADSSYLSSTIGYVLARFNKEIEDIEGYIPDFIEFLKEYASNIKD